MPSFNRVMQIAFVITFGTGMSSLSYSLENDRHTETAEALASSISIADKSHSKSAQSQQVVSEISEQTSILVDELLENSRQANIVEAYNAQLSRLIVSQEKELIDLERQIDSIEETEQVMLPMMNNMLSQLGEFVKQDLPFLKNERDKRLERLSRLLDRADVSVAEKYRQIIEAYRVEVGYGQTIEAYSGILNKRPSDDDRSSDVKLNVNYLRIGRTALYYQTLNGQSSGLWQPKVKQWKTLNSDKNVLIKKAIQVAQKQRVPELLELPVPL